MRISLDRKNLETTDEHALADEIEEAVFAARDAYAEDRKRIADANAPRRAHDNQSKLLQLKQQVLKHVNDLEITVQSTHRLVEITVYGDGDLLIRFLNNSVRRTDVTPSLLESEVNEALVKAGHTLNKAVKKLVTRDTSAPRTRLPRKQRQRSPHPKTEA